MDVRAWWLRVPAPVVDAGLAVVLACAVAVAIKSGVEQGRPPDAGAYLRAPVIGGLSLLRRRWPLAVLLAAACALYRYNLTDYPGLFSAVPLSVALATAWAAGARRRSPTASARSPCSSPTWSTSPPRATAAHRSGWCGCWTSSSAPSTS